MKTPFIYNGCYAKAWRLQQVPRVHYVNVKDVCTWAIQAGYAGIGELRIMMPYWYILKKQ